MAAQQIQQVDAVLSGLPASIDAATLVQLLLTLLGSKSRDQFFRLNFPIVDDLLDPLQTLAAWSLLDNADVATHVVTSIDALSARVREAEQARFETGIRELRRKPVFHTPNVFPPESFEPRDVHEPGPPSPAFQSAAEPGPQFLSPGGAGKVSRPSGAGPAGG